MSAQKLILYLTSVYFAFHLVRALWTGQGSFFRKRTSTRQDDPTHYWDFVAFMGICAALSAYVAQLP
jgi:hypothetical protein